MASPDSNEKTLPLPRQPDAQGFYLHCNGGIRAASVAKEVWMVEPLIIEGRPYRKGNFSQVELNALIKRCGLAPIAFHDFGWTDGNYHSKWSPLIPGRVDHMRGPADLWGSLAANIGRHARRSQFQAEAQSTKDSIAKIIDDRPEEEALARSIGLSLRSIDISVEQIWEFYNEQLVNLAFSGGTDGRRFSNTQDEVLYAHVHSFFLHLGAARDFLGALIAVRLALPRKVDSMARLVDALRPEHIGREPLLNLLENLKFIQPIPKNPNRREWSGWLKEASDLRNQFVHRRPYGAQHAEGFGHLIALDLENGLYRYVRPVNIEEPGERDILDVVIHNYKHATKLFQDLAEISGRDTAMVTITDEDIVSIKSQSNSPDDGD